MSSTTISTTVVKQSKNKRTSNAPRPAKVGRRSRNRRTASSQNPLLVDYINTSNDPFDFGPPTLGYGTFANVIRGTAYIHGTQTANADGSISFAVNCDVLKMVYYSNSGLGSTSWGSSPATNGSVIASQGSYYRVVSGGIRICPVIGRDQSPGILYAASLPNIPISTVTGLSSTTISQLPQSHIGLGVYGVTGLLRPTDDTVVEFLFQPGFTSVGGNNTGWAMPVVTFQGLPAACSVAFEVVLNLEIVPSGNSALAIGPFNSEYDPGLSGSFPIYPQLLNLVRPSLRPPINFDFTDGGPGTVRPVQTFGRGRHASGLTLGMGVTNMSKLASTLHKREEKLDPPQPTNEDTQSGFASGLSEAAGYVAHAATAAAAYHLRDRVRRGGG